MAEAVAVAVGLASGFVLHRLTAAAALPGRYPYFPFFLGALTTLLLGGVRAYAIALTGGFAVAWLLATPAGRPGQEGLAFLVGRGIVYWSCGIATLLAAEAVRRARATAARAMEDAAATAGERYETVARLRESEERYRSLVAASTAMVAACDDQGRFVSPQPGWEGYTGQPWEAHRDQGYLNALHPDDRMRIAESFAAARSGGVVYEPAARLWHAATQAYRYCTARVVPVRRPDGSVREWVASIVDVHETVLAQEALRHSEARFREMANLIPQVVWTADATGYVDYYNQQWLEFVGMTLPEALEKGWRHLVHPDDLPHVEAVFEAARRDATPVDLEFRQRGRDDRYRWFLCRAVPVRDADGTVLRWLGASTDIDEKKHAEEALRGERDLVETVNRVGRALSAELELSRLLTAITEAATRLVGADFGAFLPAGEDAPIAGFVVLDASAGDAGDEDATSQLAALRASAWLQPVLRERATVRLGGLALGAAGELSDVPGGARSALAAPLISRSGAVLGALVFGHRGVDVFDERDEQLLEGLAAQAAIAIENARLYEAERRARSEAEAANHAKDEFLSTLSHELRTPLTAMLGWVRLLREGRLKPERTAGALDTVERSGWALARIVDDLLDVSRIVTGRTRLDLQPVDLRTVLSAAVATIRPTADSKRLALDVRLDAGASIVAGDAGRLQQVVWNLLANAVKFTPAGGQVEVALEAGTREARIVVRDTGTGIPAEFLPHVFERFRQGDPGSQRQHGGLGLGLAIVRHLVELHGGEVRVASAGPGHGATFTVTLPLASAALAAVAAS